MLKFRGLSRSVSMDMYSCVCMKETEKDVRERERVKIVWKKNYKVSDELQDCYENIIVSRRNDGRERKKDIV